MIEDSIMDNTMNNINTPNKVSAEKINMKVLSEKKNESHSDKSLQ